MIQTEQRDDRWMRRLLADVPESGMLISALDWKRNQGDQPDCAAIADDIWLLCLHLKSEKLADLGIQCEPVESPGPFPFTGNVEISDILLWRSADARSK